MSARSRLGRAFALLGCLLVSCGVAGCGGQEERDIARMLSQLRTAYLQQDYRAACSHLTGRAQRAIGLIGHDEPATCQKDMERRLSSRVLSTRDLAVPRLREITVDGDRAAATATIAGAGPVKVDFARHDGVWKLSNVLGSVPRRGQFVPQPRVARNPSSPSAALGSGAGTKACPALRVRQLAVEGGCELYAEAGIATMTTLNLFGDSRFGRCPMTFALHVGPDGALAIGLVQPQLSPDPIDICGDLAACRHDDGRTVPWTGRLTSNGRGRLGITVPYLCLDTCMGRFAGRYDFDLAPRRDGRIILAGRESNLGRSGLRFSGRWVLHPVRSDARLAIS